MNTRVKVSTNDLQNFIEMVLIKNGLSKEDAEITADVLVTSDKRGIESHGVARLKRYIDGLASGVIHTESTPEIIKETPVSIVADGKGGMGQSITYKIMKKCIKKAKTNFMCFASIRNSNHYGIAGYYTKMALKENLIGISMTNSAPLVVPTFGKSAALGTNPISVGVPSKTNKPFLLDMATSTVPRGKLEVYSRKDEKIPEFWATDENGIPATDPTMVLKNMLDRIGGGLLPLGGSGELNGGHKGFGLSVVVDIFSGILSSGTVGTDIYKKKGEPAEVCHFIGAINPDAFCGLDEISENMDKYINMLKNTETYDNKNKIYIAGEKEFLFEEKYANQLDIQKQVFDTINEIGSKSNLKLNKID